jgi:hypothetical protein
MGSRWCVYWRHTIGRNLSKKNTECSLYAGHSARCRRISNEQEVFSRAECDKNHVGISLNHVGSSLNHVVSSLNHVGPSLNEQGGEKSGDQLS